MKKFAPIIADFPHLLHGGDYNPDQWLATRPEVIFEDIGLMKLAKCNTFSVGIFSWSAIEPEAGIYLWSFQSLIHLFEKMQEETEGGILIISHQERILRIADQIIYLKEGKILEDSQSELNGLL